MCNREVYYTKRMQRVFCVKWSGDCKFVLSGSDETNIRLWKAQASEKLGSVSLMSNVLCSYTHVPVVDKVKTFKLKVAVLNILFF